MTPLESLDGASNGARGKVGGRRSYIVSRAEMRNTKHEIRNKFGSQKSGNSKT
jgi:hypothetical protein